ncbi:MAG TPA: 2-hydroxyacyl-CoA dehydratase [Firmicutes bacterium]|nr:2-hydroxyacyl-CoA dehydratase [Bacillota bacterium]
MRDKLVGWTCTYIPEEIILAAGLRPVRLLGTQEPVRVADYLVPSNLCPYVRSIIDQVSSVRPDGVFVASSCNAAEHLIDALRRQFSDIFCHLVQVPRIRDTGAISYYEEQIRLMIRVIEDGFDVKITPEALKNAISIVSCIKNLLHRAYDLLKRPEPAITGGRYLRMVEMAMTADKAQAARELKDTLGGLAVEPEGPATAQEDPRPGRPRVFLVGSLCPISVVDVIEESGGVVVGEELCAGSRYFLTDDLPLSVDGAWPSGDSAWFSGDGACGQGLKAAGLGDIDIDDIIRYLAARYLAKEPCARMQDSGERYSRLVERIKALNADGVIFYVLKFCDMYLYEYPILQGRLDRLGIPVILLEGDYTAGGIEQARTRIGAFIEMLDSRRI